MHSGSGKSGASRSLRRPLLVGRENSERAGCGTSGNLRNSAPSAMGLSSLGQRGSEGAGASYIGGWVEDGAMACRVNSDLQLVHISREAQKLNQMIDSWSKSPSFDGRSTGIAADLLRGAMDLQESLLVLGKLQEASGFMAERRRRHSWNATEEEEEEMGGMCMGWMGSGRFESSSYQVTAEEGRNPVDGSATNRREELKKVIKTSLHKQKLVCFSSDEEKAPSGRSTKLPHRNGFGDTWGEQGHKTESSGSAAAGQKKAKAPNLIARLMGLEEAPSEESQPAVSWKAERKKKPVQPRHSFDIEMPKVSKPMPPPLEEKPEPESKTLHEIIEAMQFKGLLRAERSEESQAFSPAERHSRWLPTEGEAPPIVIIKPMHSASMKVEEAQRGLFTGSNHAPLQEKGQFSKAMEEEAAPKSRSPIQMENRVERSVAKDHKVEAAGKNNTLASSHVKQLKKDTGRINKKPADEMQKLVPDTGRLESRSLRSVTMSGSQTRATSSTPTRKPENRKPVQVKNHVSTQTSSSNRVEHRSTKPATRKATVDSAKERKTTQTRPVRGPTISAQVDSPTSSKEENKEVIPAQEKTIPEMSSSTLPSNLLPKEREPSSIVCTRDAGKESSFHCEVMPKRSHGGGGKSHLSRTLEQDKEISLITVPAESAEELKGFLSNSPSFLLHAHELFNVPIRHPADCHKTETRWMGRGGSKLLLDCSIELMVSRSHRFELVNHPLSHSSLKRPGTKVSMTQLVNEICEEIENLRSYGKGGDGGKDSLYERLERDLKCNRVFARGAWDCGWVEVVPIEEADRTVCGVEKLVLNALIEETAAELMLSSCVLVV